MYRLEKTFTFEASHYLPYHDGKCARRHGHSFSVTLVCEGTALVADGPKRGMLLDYNQMKVYGELVVVARLDHQDLNESLAKYGVSNPTAENLAKWVYDVLKPDLPLLVEVIIGETCTSRCIYRPDPVPLTQGVGV